MIALTSLDPEWMEHEGRRVGVLFYCPSCNKQPLLALFANPPDGGSALPVGHPSENCPVRWWRKGDAFETLSLSPSVDASASGHWHGFLTDGQCGHDPCAPCAKGTQ